MQINSLVVVGAGTMGRGIAQWFSQQGVIAQLTDVNLDQAQLSLETVHKSWDKLCERGKFTKDEVEKFKTQLVVKSFDDLDPNSDLVIEAIVENIQIKTELFQKLDRKMNAKTVFSSNTSSIPIATLAKELSSERRERFLGLHFFNPAPIMKLVEVIEGHWTAKDLSKNLYSWFESKGKKPAICKDSPGFIVNRVARNFYGESLRIVNTYDQEKIKEVDTVLKEVGGFKMGAFELMDLIGIDVNFSVTQSVWHSYFNEARFAPHRLQKEMVDSGRHGKKSREGFYKYE